MTLAGLSLAIGPLVDTAIISPGEHASAPGAGGHGGGRGLPRQQRGGPAGAGRQPLHPAGAGPLGRDAQLGTVPLSAHGAGRDLRDGRGLPAVQVVRADAVRRLAAAAPDLEGSSTTGDDHEDRNEHEFSPPRSWIGRLRDRWEAVINRGIDGYERGLAVVLRRRLLAICVAVGLLVAAVLLLGTRLRREFFPEVDAGAFEIYVRAPSGTRIEVTEANIAAGASSSSARSWATIWN